MDKPDDITTEEYYDESILQGRKNPETQDEAARPRRRKKHYLLRVLVVLVLCASVYFVMISSIFDIHTIEVIKNGTHYSESDVIAMSGIKNGDNLFKIRTGKAEEAMRADPYVKEVKVKRILPNSLSITLRERKESFVILYQGKYLLVGDSNEILSVMDQPNGLTLVEGMDVFNATPGVKIDVRDKQSLKNLQELLKSMNNEGMSFERIDMNGIVPRIYIKDRLIIEGKWKDLTDGMNSLKVALMGLEKRGITEGVIKVSGNRTCNFSPDFPDQAHGSGR